MFAANKYNYSRYGLYYVRSITFYNTLSKQVVTFAERKKRLSVGESAIVHQEAIYARVIGLLVSQRDLDLQQILATELTAYPPS